MIENKFQIDDWDKYFFNIVNVIARKSKDPSSKVGSLIVKSNHILSSGFNGMPIGVEDLPDRYSNRELKYQLISHSESNACMVGARFGVNLCDSTIFTHSVPCVFCAKQLIQCGVKVVKTLSSCNKIWKEYQKNWNESVNNSIMILKESGVELVECDIKCFDQVLIGGILYEI